MQLKTIAEKAMAAGTCWFNWSPVIFRDVSYCEDTEDQTYIGFYKEDNDYQYAVYQIDNCKEGKI